MIHTAPGDVPAKRSFVVYLLVLVAACILPVLFLSTFLLYRLYETQKEISDEQTLGTARALVSAVDRELSHAQYALFSLRASPELRRGDYESFYRQSAQIAHEHGAWIQLVDTSGRQIFDTHLPYGAPLPPAVLQDETKRVIETAVPQISGLFKGDGDSGLRYAVLVPVIWDEAVHVVLRMSFNADAATALLAEQRLPLEGTAAIIDGRGVIVGRNRAPESFVGNVVTADLRNALREQKEKAFIATVEEGTPVYATFSRSGFSGWAVAIGLPKALVDAPLRKLLLHIVSGSVLLLGLSIAVSFAVGLRIRRSIHGLTAAAIALGRGDELPPTPTSPVRELSMLRNALGAAKHLLDGERERRSATEDKLRRSNEGLALAQHIAELGSWEIDVESGSVAWSDEMYRIRKLSRDEFTPDTVSVLSTVHEDEREEVRAWLGALSAGCALSGLEFRIVRSDGEIRTVRSDGQAIRNDQGKVIKVAGTMQDITERVRLEQRRRELETQLHHSQKLQALGTLAGGVAHEFNNDLLAIAGLLDMALDQLPEESPSVRPLRRAGDAIEHARDVVRQILTFSRRDEPRRERLRADLVVGGALDLLQASLPNAVQLRRHLSSHDDIFVDRSQLQQVVLNLGGNAAHAITEAITENPPRIDHGLIEVRLDTITLDAEREVVPSDLPDGTYVRLSFTDNGKGIPAAMLDRIFEPFFTTKPPGDGTGLGLAVVHGIAATHGGAVTAESVEGHGTCVTIFFPLASQRQAASPAEIRIPNAASA